jgi:subtilisin
MSNFTSHFGSSQPVSASLQLSRSSPSSSHLTQRQQRFAKSFAFKPAKFTSNTQQATTGVKRFRGASSLERRDRIDPNFKKRYYYEDWSLPKNTAVGQLVEVSLRSKKFDTFLYLVGGRSRRGTPLLSGLDTRFTNGSDVLSTDSRLVFTVKPGVRYRLRASSTNPRTTGRYTIDFRVYPASSSEFSFFYGSGLVDAGAAVARAVGSPAFRTNTLLGGNDWGRDLVQAPAVWDQGFTGQGVTVAVIDSGVDYTHSELKNNIWTNTKEIANNGIDDDQNGYIDDVRGWNFLGSGDNDPNDSPTDGHGTHVAGTIAAARDGLNVTGVAPDAKIMPLRVFDENSTIGDPTLNLNIIRGIDYAISNGAKVINLSLRKAIRYDFELGAALQRAAQAGVVVVVAAGNDRQNEGMLQPSELAFRAMINNLGIAVGAVNQDKKMALFSNPAGQIVGNFVVAPGVAVRSTIPLDQFTDFDGTSMASPHVAGVAALMLSANPNLTPIQVYSILTRTANPRGVEVSP